MYDGPGGDQQFAEAEIITTIGLDCPAIHIDLTHATSQMDLNIAILIERMIMDQSFNLVRTLEKKVL